MKKNILIIDDEKLILLGLTAALKCDSIEVATASSGVTALEKVKSFPAYDLCVVDLTLPDINGLELIKDIKKTSPSTNFIIMSGKFRDKKDLIENAGADIDISAFHFITKPFDFAKTQEIVFQAIKGK